MFLEFTAPLEVIEDYIKNTVLKECTENGLLSDIRSTKTIFKDLSITDVPAIWIYLAEWKPEEMIANRGNSRAKITYPVEVCVITNKADLTDSDKQATNILSRVVESLFKNWRRRVDTRYNIICDGIRINRGYSDGQFKIASKQQKVAVKGVLAEFIFELDWIKCLNVTIEENELNNGG